jgi:hypothetical protein
MSPEFAGGLQWGMVAGGNPHKVRTVNQLCSLCRTLVVSVGLLLIGGCSTYIHNPDAFQTGKVLPPSENEFEFSSPAYIGYARGIGNGLELRASTGLTGQELIAWGPDEDDFNPGDTTASIMGLDIGLTKSLAKETINFVSASFSLGGFTTAQSPCFSGGRLSAGLNLGIYPISWFGVYAPIRMTGTVAQQGNYEVDLVPGVGFTFERWRLIFRGGVNLPIGLFAHHPPASLSPDYALYSYPYFGFQLGYRWGED